MTKIIVEIEDEIADKLRLFAKADERSLTKYCKYILRDFARDNEKPDNSQLIVNKKEQSEHKQTSGYKPIGKMG